MRINIDLIETLLQRNGLNVELTAFFSNKISKSILHAIEKVSFSNILKQVNRINQKDGLYEVQTKNYSQILCPSWIFAQKKVFIWVTLNLLYQKTVEIHNTYNCAYIQDENFIIEINQYFPAQPLTFIAYQLREFGEKQTNRRWVFEQQQILRDIVSHLYPQMSEINWKTVAYSLFLKSQRRFYRTFHQIRQKWLNYLDASIKKGKWSPQQDLQLFLSIQKWGKRWSRISREIGKSRTEHMVKNRFNSLLKKYKHSISSLSEQQTLQFLQQKAKEQLLNINQDAAQNNKNTYTVSDTKYTQKLLLLKSRKPRSKVKQSIICQSMIMTDLESKSSFNGLAYENLMVENQQSDEIKIDWALDDNNLFFRTELFDESIEQVLNFQYQRDFHDQIEDK